MRDKMNAIMTAILVLSIFSLVLVTMAAAAGSITLTPTAQAQGASVTVAGTGFGATRRVAIAIGAESAVSETNMAYIGTSDGLTWSGRVAVWPIKPGSFVLTSDTTSGGGQDCG